MKRINLIIILISFIIITTLYSKSFDFLGNNKQTIVNTPIKTTIDEKKRLEDDFYNYVNYEYLSNNKLNDKAFDGPSFDDEKVEEEKNKIIDELLEKDIDNSKKMKTIYDLYMQNNSQDSLEELNKYISKIKETENVEEFINTAIDINYQLSTDILVSPCILNTPKCSSKNYFGLNLITYDWDNFIGYYSIADCEYKIRMFKKYDIQILKQYGYSAEEASKIADDVQEMYKKISLFSELNTNNLFENGYKVYSMEELQSYLTNIKLNNIIKYYEDFYSSDDGILVADINQLKLVDTYLKEENLDTLKNYAILKILTSYCCFIDDDFLDIYINYCYESNNYIKKEEKTKIDIAHKILYDFFQDTITEEFFKRHFTKEQKEFYSNLIKDEIDIYKNRIIKSNWLSSETKEKALAKLEKIRYTVAIPDNFVKTENNYEINKNSSYIDNIINMKQNLKKEEMIQHKKGNIMYNNEMGNQLTVNAYYLPNNNSINLFLGFIYTVTENLDIDKNNLQDNYYTILGSIGAVIGHELSHALDTTGSKYDEYGNYIDWWNEEDKYNFNILVSKVVKYYENYEQFGNTTVGENIADLGGVAVILQLAENKNASSQDYKTIFESYAKIYASQQTSIYQEYLLKNDEHSPNKNRVNAVFSCIDKFYEIYNIKKSDKMYVSDEDRVSIW